MEFSGSVMLYVVSVVLLRYVNRRLNKLMEDWSSYPSRSFAKRAMGADGDQDKLRMLSDGIQNAANTFLVSLPC